MRNNIAYNILKGKHYFEKYTSICLYNVSIAQSTEDTPDSLKPQGIGMAVAFDWGLAVQILVTPFMALLLGLGNNPVQQLKIGQPWITLLFSLLSLPFAALLAIFGEGVRRGWRWTRRIQVGFNAPRFSGWLCLFYSLWQSSKHGNYWSAVTTVILLVFSPLIAWRMSRPTTRAWFKTVSSPRPANGIAVCGRGSSAVWAIVGGILQAIAALK